MAIASTAALAGLAAIAGTAAVGTGIAGAAGAFGGGEKKRETFDPLAGIRQQLQALAAGVPEMVEKRKARLRELFGEAKELGLQDIGEEFRGERGFGASTMETRRRSKFIEDLSKSLAGEELAAEEWGAGRQASFLGSAAGIKPELLPEEAGWGEQLMGMGGEMFGQELGYNRLQDLFKDKTDLMSAEDLTKRMGTWQDVLRKPSTIYG